MVRAAAAGGDGTPAARERAKEIHQSILDGAAFEDVALEHSDDPASRSRGQASVRKLTKASSKVTATASS